MRNCSLVKRSCADNSTGLKLTTEATVQTLRDQGLKVGEHSINLRSFDASRDGGDGREYASMSSDNPGGNPGHRKPKVS